MADDTSTAPMNSSPPSVQSAGSRGQTTIDDAVVSKIASIATREVEGVAALGGAISGAVGSVVGRIRGSQHATAGVGVEVGQTQAAVDLTVKVHYPVPIPDVAEQVRQNVIDRIESLTGLEVVEVNIGVVDLAFPGDEDGEGEQQPEQQSRVQ